jgi:hypothetical protein
MTKNYRNYIGVGTLSTYDERKEAKGIFDSFDKQLDYTVISATGGTILTPGNGYTYHVFTSPGNFVVSGEGNIEILAVAGAGGGGSARNRGGGGGGAGGIAHYTSYFVNANTYAVTIGAGGGSGAKGSDTIFGGLITAKGGGNGGNADFPGVAAGGPGGSGGGPGGTALQPSQPLVAGQSGTNYGNAAAPVVPGFLTGAGGGGAGGTSDTGGVPGGALQGGESQPFPTFAAPLIAPAIPGPNVPIIGPSGLYGAGGNGGGATTPTPGGGGAGGSNSAGSPGTGYGSGGGGGSFPNNNLAGGAGSQGIVIVRYIA